MVGVEGAFAGEGDGVVEVGFEGCRGRFGIPFADESGDLLGDGFLACSVVTLLAFAGLGWRAWKFKQECG